MAVWNVILNVVVWVVLGGWLAFVGISWASWRVWLLMLVFYRLGMGVGAGGA